MRRSPILEADERLEANDWLGSDTILPSIVHEGRTFECFLCKYSVAGVKKLRQHMKTHNSRVRHGDCDPKERRFFQFACDQCPKKYNLKSSLNQHKVTHKDKVFGCDECDKNFYSITRLNIHKQIHLPNRQRAFKCDSCVKSFFKK